MRFPRVIDYMFENRAVRLITEVGRPGWDTSAENLQLSDSLVGIPTMDRPRCLLRLILPQPASRRSSLICSEICCEDNGPNSGFVGKPTDYPSSSGFTSRRYAAIHFRACRVGYPCSLGDFVHEGDSIRAAWVPL